ncbi:MAG TPA: ATPase, T2SS/T4P/T4SS family, partial [Planctomycetaceae bacterium]
MIFRRKRQEEPEEQEQIEYVLFQGPLNGNAPDLRANAKLAQVALIPTKELVTDAILRRAEMIRLDPKGNAALVRLYVDGVPYPAARMPRQQGVAVTQMVKLLAGLDVKERGKPQAGGLNAEHDGIKYELRVQVAPGEGAERLIVRIENLKTRPERPDELGFSTAFRDKLRELTDAHSGGLFCCGPPGSGVTTTTFGILRALDPYTRTILTLGDTENRKLIAINPFEWNEGDDVETTIKRVLRNEPNVLFVDPIRDAETARLLFRYTDMVSFVAEFAAKDVSSGVQQLIQWTGDPNVVAEGLRGLVSPKLIRKLCPKCKQVFKPNPKAVAKLGLPPETQMLYRPPRPPAAGTPEADAWVP